MIKIIYIIIAHILADIVLQGERMEELKKKRMLYLIIHTCIYTFVLLIASQFIIELTVLNAVLFALFNGALHFVVDYITGKMKGVAWKNKKENLYTSIVAIDHLVHLIILFLSYELLFNGHLLSI